MLLSTAWRISLGAFLLGAGLYGILLNWQPMGLPFIPNADFSDAAVSHWPSAVYLRGAVLGGGEFPLWRESIMGGAPFAANPLNKTAYPLTWLTLILPPALGLNLLILLHVGLAGWGMWRWLAALELRREAVLLGTLALMLSPRLLAHLGAGHLDIVYALAWFPWLMSSVRRDADPYRVAFFAGLLVLGDVRVGMFALVVAAVYGLAENRTHHLWRWPLAAALFLLLTAALWLPLAGWRPYMSRNELTPSDAGEFSMQAAEWLGMIFPPHQGSFETLAYLGLPVLVLVGISAVTAPRRHALWLVLLLGSALYALGDNFPLWRVLVEGIPGLTWFRVPARAWLVVALIAPLLAAYGLETLLNAVESGAISARGRVATFIGLVMAATCGLTSLWILPLPASISLSILVMGVMLGVALFCGANGWLSASKLAAAIILLTVFDLAWFGTFWLEWRGPAEWRDPYAPLAERLLADDAERIYSPTYSLPQQTVADAKLALFGGVDPFQLVGTVKAIQGGAGVFSEAYSVAQPPLLDMLEGDIHTANRHAKPDTALLGQWGVSHVIAAYPIEHPRLVFLDQIGEVLIYRNQDYQPLVGRWPSDADDLPSESTIQRLNRLTIAAMIASSLTFIRIAGMLLWRR